MLVNPVTIVAYLALFAVTGILFVAASLLVGRFLRAHAPTPEKLETYECGEPAVGSSFIQFDLRFYVVALVFIIFDVEVAFFFPWATVFGTATALMNPRAPQAIAAAAPPRPGEPTHLSPITAEKLRGLGVRRPTAPKPLAGPAENDRLIVAAAGNLARAAMIDVAVFFGVLLVGFAYVWAMGDLDWVRATRWKSALPAEDGVEEQAGEVRAAAATAASVPQTVEVVDG